MTGNSTVHQSSGFLYKLGEQTKSGYGANPSEAADAVGTSFHRQTVEFILRRNPRGFLRLTRKLSRRVVYKSLHFLFGPNSPSRIFNFLFYLRERHRKSSVRYMPPLVFVDPTACQSCAYVTNFSAHQKSWKRLS